ncbi:MAG: ATP-grasp ribosomal peptide maturase [Actinophytocola sp.]|uniref:ATP-grasp ribosomal peptide maturase n=1 Tax=Actinophytocola sp. TaxID=1872138 RepID=UPI00132B7EC4|nr:ATP-grasp ribosomal peptide maturase [Actinophytocola sp.]MPZ83136.1 ATP-grasp ribosomal peptide maturase [Actinophytocola sp.]
MGAARSVLVLTDRFDPTADRVVEELNSRETPVVRCDVADFPERLSVSAELNGGPWSGAWLQTARRSVNLAEVSGIYYRRPTGFDFHPDLSADERRWSAVQARMGFGGLLAAVGPWLNHPHHIGYAEYKPTQLRSAVACGLQVPRTLVTNDPTRARAFVTDVGSAVYKPFGGHGVTDTEGYRHVFANVVTPEQCDDPNIARTMHMFQQWVPKSYEVRLTVVDGQFFAARIDTESAVAYVDWRADYKSLTYTAVETPNFVQGRVTELLRELNLRFGALDFVVAPDGAWWFLECNPNGQWAWIEDETGMPIAAAIADALEGYKKP